MTITYNPNNGDFYAVIKGQIFEGTAPTDMNLEEFLNHLLLEIKAGFGPQISSALSPEHQP